MPQLLPLFFACWARVTPIALLLLLPGALRAQAGATVIGRVVRATDREPLSGVRLRLGERETTSGADGRFVLTVPSPGALQLRATAVGLMPRQIALQLAAGDTVRLDVLLAPLSVQLDDVVVTAQELRGTPDGSSVSRIERAAIEHVQASSLADLLQLVPGQPALNPTLAGARQALLRQASTTSTRDPGPGTEAERANALGTAVVLDGVPVSNNANLQTNLTILNSGPNALPPFSSTANRGLDLRQVPADNIERLEVIRGIPSARHGDLTAGAILVTSRAGQQDAELRVRANPLTLEASSVRGWGGGVRRPGLTLDGNFVTSQDDPRSARGRFGRATGQFAWSQPWGADAAVRTTLRVRGYSVIDELRRDPDDRSGQSATSATDRGGRVDLQATWRHDNAARWQTALTASATYAEQVGTFQDVVTRDIFPISGARQDTLAPGVFGRSEYITRLTVDGRPLNVYSRLETTGALSRGATRHSAVAGLELRHDANRGAGRLFDPLEPPRQNFGVGDRPNSFRDVPSLTMASAYVEDRVRTRWAGGVLDAQAGLRYDLIDPVSVTQGRRGRVLAPRLNVLQQWRPWIGTRLGYGVNTKSPTLAQLYPLPRYFDLISFNHYPVNPAERLVMFTTRVVQPVSEVRQPARAEKIEAAIEVSRWRTLATLTTFSETTRGAFGTTRVPLGIAVPRLRADSFPVGRPPVLAATPAAIDTFVAAYDVPRNSRRIRTQGAELTADFPEITRLRTQLVLGAGWFRTVATDDDLDIPVEQFIGGATQAVRVGAYDAGRGVEASQFISSLRLVHRAPAVGMLVSLLLQTTWADDDRPVGRINGVPVGFVDRSGLLTRLTPEQAAAPEFAGLVRPTIPLQQRWERRRPLHLVNLRLTKSLPARSQFALFVNNALADRPLHERVRTLGFERRNPPLFFGAEVVSFVAFPSLR